MAEEIVWGKSLAGALAQAKTEKKLVLAAFFSQECGACIKMKESTLVTESVREYVTRYFVAVKYESGMDSEQFMRFNITGKPAVIVLDPSGDEIFRKIGYFEPDVFIDKLEKARKKAAHKTLPREK